jgi:hypothetical protein
MSGNHTCYDQLSPNYKEKEFLIKIYFSLLSATSRPVYFDAQVRMYEIHVHSL